MKPMCTNIRRNTVTANSGGNTTKYNSTAMMPGASRCTIYPSSVKKGEPGGALGKLCPNPYTQKYCDRSTLLSTSTLCGSQYSNGPKKFQFGPRKNVPRMISVTHSSRNPS